jgi:hypothetical protein
MAGSFEGSVRETTHISHTNSYVQVMPRFSLDLRGIFRNTTLGLCRSGAISCGMIPSLAAIACHVDGPRRMTRDPKFVVRSSENLALRTSNPRLTHVPILLVLPVSAWQGLSPDLSECGCQGDRPLYLWSSGPSILERARRVRLRAS